MSSTPEEEDLKAVVVLVPPPDDSELKDEADKVVCPAPDDSEDIKAVVVPDPNDSEVNDEAVTPTTDKVIFPAPDDSEVRKATASAALFQNMAAFPWPYMLFWPILFAFLLGFGWSQEDIIEDEVTNIWIPQSGSYAADIQYAADLGQDDLSSSSFAAMAIARDGKNLFTEERLEEIRARMEKMERTTITYKGVTYNWEDVCASNAGFPYEFPCARLTPMDLFQEASWFMDYTGPDSVPEDPSIPAPKQDLYRRTWYKELIQELLVQPRIPRFGVMTGELCAGQCAFVLGYRLSPASEGFSPFSLFADIGNLEMTDPCRICIETGYSQTILSLKAAIGPIFQVLTAELQRFAVSGTNDTQAQALAAGIAAKSFQLAGSISSNDVEEFYFYYVTRGVYAQLGTDSYVENYKRLEDSIEQCQAAAGLLGLTCPEVNITRAIAEAALLRHADNVFSSVSTAGSPLPLWSEGDGTGELFKGNSPVGGSGIDMSANIFSMLAYLNATSYGQPGWSPLYEGGASGFADPTTATWTALVEKNPMYAWFMASLTEAENTTACGNSDLTGTNLGVEEVDQSTALLAKAVTQNWCTKYSIPNTDNPGEGPYTQQHFARMWYDRLIDSSSFLGLTEGVDDPYSWTTGQGCGYDLRGQRDPYTGMTEESILYNASRELYFIDEGESVGVISPDLIIGDVKPGVGDYSFDNPLQEVGVLQSLYAALLPNDIVQRVRHCKRPGGPLEITVEDAEEILYDWKEAMENAWTEGWDNENDGDVQFVAFFDDSGVIGSTGRMLKEITLGNNKLTAISILAIALFSCLFLFSRDLVQSRVLITLIGVALVTMAFFSALGFALLLNIKISVTIAWTLPFIVLGIGVDDMYIVLGALKKQGGYEEKDFIRAMKETIVPVTMTSLVNLCMFAILNVSDIPAIYITAQVAVYCVILLYGAIVFCFPAYCWLDMKRQAAGKKDFFFCCDHKGHATEASKDDFRSILLYDKFYQPLVLGTTKVRVVSHLVLWLIAAALFSTGVYGITQREVGLGLEDFFPSSNQASVWATKRTESLASWSIGMNWGALDYTNGDTQMLMIKQFEDVVATPHLAEVDTKRLWIADFILWTTRLCSENFDREDFDVLECGRDKKLATGPSEPVSSSRISTFYICSATWKPNEFGLREKIFSDINDPVCHPNEGGICRPGERMHPDDLKDLGLDAVLSKTDVFCPTIDNWSDELWQFCLVEWRNTTGYTGGRFILEEDRGSPTECDGDYNKDEKFTWPILLSSGPTMFASDLFSHADTLEMMGQTRAFCDQDEDLHCWMTGIPYDYWTQYEGIFAVLIELAGYSTLAGFAIAFIFLFVKLSFEDRYSRGKIFWGSLIGALLIAATIILSLTTVVGISVLSGVSLTGFSLMSFTLSSAYSTEYSVHIVSRWLRAPQDHQTGVERVKYTMSFLMLPTFMSFVSSTIGVVCLAFTEFEFNQVFFFRPLIIVMAVTYFFGCWWLPALLTLLDFDVVKLGKPGVAEDGSSENTNEVATNRPGGGGAGDEVADVTDVAVGVKEGEVTC